MSHSTTQDWCDERIALARRGALSASDWADFATHLATCPDCRIAWRLASDFEGSAVAEPGDERVVARAARAALASSTTARARTGIVRVAFAAAAMLVVAGVASGAMMLRERWAASVGERAGPALAPKGRGHGDHRTAQANGPTAPNGTNRPEPSDPATTPDETAPLRGADDSKRSAGSKPSADSKTDLGSGPASRASSSHALAAAPRPGLAATIRRRPAARKLALLAAPIEPPPLAQVVPEPPPPPAVLLEQAVQARRTGHLEEAIASFRRLETEFPDTPESRVSRVSLGDLLLRVGAPAEALAAFEAYEHAAPEGALLPEALAGQARALAALGHVNESRAIWRDLAQRFPGAPTEGAHATGITGADAVRP